MRFIAFAAMLAAPSFALAADAAKNIMTFDTMYGVEGPFLGDDRPLRLLPGDELPWEGGTVHGTLWDNGHIVLDVDGIVFAPDSPLVPLNKRGINDERSFRAVVSCLSERGDLVKVENRFTKPFPATIHGSAHIDDYVKLPDSCVAPIIFVVAGDENYWFAVTGAEIP